MKKIVKALSVLILILSSCTREVVEPSQQITGRYALDDGTGLTSLFLEFDGGALSGYQSTTLFPIAENRIWNCKEDDYDLYWRVEYSIQEGNLFSDFYSGPIKKDGDSITMGSSRHYIRLDGFRDEPYSLISPEKIEYEIPLQEGEYSFPVTIENPIPAGELTAFSSDNWITGLTVKDDIVLYRVSTTNTPREGRIILEYTQASDVQVTVKQSPSTFIRLEETSRTIGYAATTVIIPYSIDNPIDGSELTVSSTAEWCQNFVIQSDNLIVSIPDNNSGSSRTARLTFSYAGAQDVGLYLTQEWSASIISMTPSSAQFEYAAGTGSFTFEIQNPREGVTVSATSLVGWITDVSVTDNTVSYKVSENNSGSKRTGNIRISYGSYATVNYTVVQKYTAASIVFTPSSVDFDYNGGTGSFSFEILNPRESISCTATSQVDWITDVLVGESTVSFKITENNSWAKRTESIEIKYGDLPSNVFNITQNGNPELIPDGTVDLGLSVLWASCNLGEIGLVSSPEEYGAYYAWGETETKDNYSWSTYKFGNSSSGPFSKYNTKSLYGTVDNKTVLETGPNGDDVASKKLGGKWRMPTYEEWTALRTNCTWTWTSNYNNTGIAGRIVKSNVSGHTDKSIFLPAAGYRNVTGLYNAGSRGYYWSSSLYTVSPYYAWDVYFNSDNVGGYNNYRYNGLSVRPVSE
ncbi:MAG: hypothetical protein J6T02_05705 [Bacteroidales bacterium]|nr:hypothetical protein [Bacteroidales bacterium]